MAKEFTQKWTIASYFNEQVDGYEFEAGHDPLHVTLAGVFKVGLSGGEILEMIERLVHDEEQIEITAAEEAYFGPYENVRVVLIEPSERLADINRKICGELLSKGAIFDELRFELDGYRPHSTVQKTGRLQSGQKAVVKNVTLLDMFPDGNGRRRRITRTIRLKETG